MSHTLPDKQMDNIPLRERIRTLAFDVGFDLAGFAPAEPPACAQAYADWLQKGFHSGMTYMAREPEVRLDIRRWAQGAQSVLVVAKNYYVPVKFPVGTLIIARYALGEDYHLWMKKRLISLGRRISELLEHQVHWRTFLDTAPVLERAYAMGAGIGWIGKNAMLIHPRLGSYLFLGGIVLDLPLPPDPVMQDHCGRCRRCLDACPTGAIVAPRVVDARLCLAYHTIETRTPIPPDIRKALGRRFFGCDICQEVCPMNREPEVSRHPNLVPTQEARCQPRSILLGLTAERILSMSDAELLRLCRRSALRRAGFVGLRRTAYAMCEDASAGNAEMSEHVPRRG